MSDENFLDIIFLQIETTKKNGKDVQFNTRKIVILLKILTKTNTFVFSLIRILKITLYV